MDLPRKITIRISTYMDPPVLFVEHDEHEVGKPCRFDPGDEAGTIMKGIEVALTTLGYTPDLNKMYIDMALMKLDFYRT